MIINTIVLTDSTVLTAYDVSNKGKWEEKVNVKERDDAKHNAQVWLN